MATRVLAAAAVCAATHAAQGATLLDDFKNVALWKASASDQVRAALARRCQRRQPVPRLRLQRRLGLRGDEPRAACGLAAALRPAAAFQRRRRGQRLADEAGRCERRQRVVDQSTGLRAARQAHRDEAAAPAHRLRVGADGRPHAAADAHHRVRDRGRPERRLGRSRLAVHRAARTRRTRARSFALASTETAHKRQHARSRLPP